MQQQSINTADKIRQNITHANAQGNQSVSNTANQADLQACLSRPDLWRGNRYFSRTCQLEDSKISATGTGYPVLDALLPDGGWSPSDLTEISVPDWGQGEMRLLMPALSSLARQGKRIALVSPPMLPYTPAIAASGIALEQMICIQARQSKDALWSMEKLLRCADVGAVLCWTQLNFQQARRLQMAAQAGDSLGFVLNRHHGMRPQTSLPAGIRIRAQANSGDSGSGLAVKFIKLRNQCDTVSVQLNWH